MLTWDFNLKIIHFYGSVSRTRHEWGGGYTEASIRCNLTFYGSMSRTQHEWGGSYTEASTRQHPLITNFRQSATRMLCYVVWRSCYVLLRSVKVLVVRRCWGPGRSQAWPKACSWWEPNKRLKEYVQTFKNILTSCKKNCPSVRPSKLLPWQDWILHRAHTWPCQLTSISDKTCVQESGRSSANDGERWCIPQHITH